MKVNLKKIGGSVMMVISPIFMEELNINSESTVEVAVHKGQLIVKPEQKPSYTLEDLLAQCDKSSRVSEDHEWLNAPRLGREIL
jgi:antitoxin ChpS